MRWFKNLRTMPKLMIGFGTMAALLAFVGYQGISGMNRINTMLNGLYERDLQGITAVKEAETAIAKIGREMRQAVIDPDLAAMQADDLRIDQQFAALDEALDRAEKTFVTTEGKAMLARYKAIVPELRTGVKEVVRLTMAKEDKAAIQLMVKTRAIAERLGQASSDASEQKFKIAKQAYEESDVVHARLRIMLIVCMAVATLMALIFGYFLATLVAKPLNQAVDVLQSVADGDLTRTLDVQTTDEMGQMAKALNTAVEGMRDALTEVRGSADSLAASSQELAASSEQLSSGAQEQASSLEETSASLEEITSSVKQNADSARQANQLAAAARDTAEKGGHVVAGAVTAMGEINTSSKKIAEIITAIDEIAFQTNLLALNAAVEAARAGEQGRGFAVVAAEVRTLAQRSATAAKEIKALIQDSVRKVETGSQMVNQSGEVLSEIVSSVKRVTDIVGEIASASAEQSSGVEQVGRAMSQMDQVTQQTAAQTEELSSTAQSLSSSAEQLQALVGRFRLEQERRARQASQAKAARPAADTRNFTKNVRTLSSRISGRPAKEIAPAAVTAGPGDSSLGGFGEF